MSGSESDGAFGRRLEGILDVFVVFFGVWTLFCNVLVFGGASFRALLILSPLPLVVSAGLLSWWRRRASGPAAPPPVPREPRVPLAWKLAIAAVLVVGYAWTRSFTLFWAAAALFLVGCLLDQPRRRASDTGSDGRVSRFDVVVFAAVLVAAIVFTGVVHRPDADDAMYMSIPVALLDHPDRPMLQGDTMHGEEEFPLLGPFYRVTSYEVFVGTVAFVTRLDPRIPYYVFFPLAFAALVIVAHWLPLRQVAPRAASLGVLLVFVVLTTWGDVHHTYGNFGFVRLFQGKAVLVSLCAPAVVYYGMRYSARGDLVGWLRLALAQIAMMGFSVSGIFVAPLLAGLVLLGGWRPDRRSTRVFLVGLLASAVVVLEGAVITGQVREFGAFVSLLDSASTTKSLALVLGRGCRSYLALFALLAAAATSVAAARGRGNAGYLTAAFLLLLNPWAGDLITRVEPTVAWRSLWAVPFPLIAGMLGAQIAERSFSRRGFGIGVAGALVFALAFALCPGRWTASAENKARWRLAALEVGEGRPAAERAVAVTPPGGTILAPRRVAMWITGIRGHPRLLAVRQDYLEVIVAKVLGEEEARRRRTLMEFVHGKLGAGMSLEMADEIVQREIDTVVTHPDLAARGGAVFFDELSRREYGREKAAHGYVIWTRNGPAGMLDARNGVEP